MTEFEIIEHYFNKQNHRRLDVETGIGDDAAIIAIPPGHRLIVTTDTLVAGVHFFEDAPALTIGHKALAVNLSDLAAMGATPAWVTLSLTLPRFNQNWVQSFCDGFFTLANRYHMNLVGGDLTRGPLSITVQAMGYLPENQNALLRSSAKPGDIIYVTGTLGDAGLALAHLKNRLKISKAYLSTVMNKLNRPEPRIAVGEALTKWAHAAIDISDGLIADLKHILEKSQVGAVIDVERLPLSQALTHTLPTKEALALALCAGDDYELCFTVPVAMQEQMERAQAALVSHSHCPITAIGRITTATTLELLDENGNPYHGQIQGYQHF